MNWTGGRLQRHSNHFSGTLGRSQKQNFAKSRLISTKGSNGAPWLTDFAKFGASIQAQNSGNEKHRHESVELPRDSPVLPDQKNASQPSNRLNQIKRQLLEKTDWAAVGAAQPLKITFTPVEEVERFGKRRKLTEADRARLASSDGGLLRSESGRSRKKPRENASSETPGIDDLEIRINGQRCDAGRAAMPLEHYQTASSQPMLLDRDVSVCPDQESNPSARSYGGVYSQSRRTSPNGSLSSLRNELTIPGSSAHSLFQPQPLFPGLDIAESVVLYRPSVEQTHRMEFFGQNPREPTRTPLQSHNSVGYAQTESPLRRRFTIDNQVAAEKEQTLNNAFTTNMSRSLFGSEQLDEGRFTRPPGHHLPIGRVPSYYHELESTATDTQSSSGWLPEPRCSIQRRLDKPLALSPFNSSHESWTRLKANASPRLILGRDFSLAESQTYNEERDSSTPWQSQHNREIPDAERNRATSVSTFSYHVPDSSRPDMQSLSQDRGISEQTDTINKVYTGTPIFSDSNPASPDGSRTPSTIVLRQERIHSPGHNQHEDQLLQISQRSWQDLTSTGLLMETSSPDPLLLHEDI